MVTNYEEGGGGTKREGGGGHVKIYHHKKGESFSHAEVGAQSVLR